MKATCLLTLILFFSIYVEAQNTHSIAGTWYAKLETFPKHESKASIYFK
jgi:hypothetical protein